MGLYDRFKRWKRSKGFGVHSPEAYRMVRRVIRPRKEFAFYGEEHLDLSEAPRRLVRQAKLLLRLTAYEQPSFVWTSPSLPEILLEAIREAGGVIRIFDAKLFPGEIGKSDMVVVYRGKLTAAQLAQTLVPGKTLVAFEVGKPFMQSVMKRLEKGIILEWRNGLIAVPRLDSEKYVYSV